MYLAVKLFVLAIMSYGITLSIKSIIDKGKSNELSKRSTYCFAIGTLIECAAMIIFETFTWANLLFNAAILILCGIFFVLQHKIDKENE